MGFSGASKAGDGTISVGAGHVNLTPIIFHSYAEQYLTACRTAEAAPGFSPVPYYLCCRSLELSVKAYLLTRGITVEELKSKKLGHDLLRNLTKAQSVGLSDIVTITPDERRELRKANAYYAKKDFEYGQLARVVKGYPEMPALEVLDRLAARLVQVIGPICLAA